MGKDIKPKINPKLQRLKRMSVEELTRISKQTALKAVTRAAKTVKINLILKSTKRISSFKQANNESNDDDKAVHDKELQDEIEKLKSLKAIDQSIVGKYLALERFPQLFAQELSVRKLKSSQGDVDSEAPSDVLLQSIRSHKKFEESLGKTDSEILMLQAQIHDKVRKELNVMNAQAVTKKPMSLGKVNALFDNVLKFV
jgi:hypothetical protein